MSMLKQLTLNCDARIGQFLAISHIAYTRETILRDGRGSYTREEWMQARRAGYNQTGTDSIELDSEAGFLRRAFGLELRKLQSGLRLAKYIRHTDCRSILEVGCGEMITSWAVKGSLPDLRYCATDYDDFIIEKCRKLQVLNSLEKASLDIDAVPTSFLREFQLVIAWDVFYAFDTARFVRFLKKVKTAGCSLMICSSQIIGPMRGFSYLIKSYLGDYAGQCRAGQLRNHGHKCSLGYYQQVVRSLGLECQLIETPPILGLRTGDCYFFIRISSATSGKAKMPIQSTT